MAFLTDSEMIARIDALRKQHNAIILAHNYQLAEVQDIADFTGDSLELSVIAARNDADVIVFCGVHFMAETAYILAPGKTVLLPVKQSGCLMADMADAEDLKKLKAANPGAIAVCYVNSTAAVKAECELCVTSANAAKLVGKLPANQKIIFVPDMNLGANVAKETGRDMILWQGFCPTHMRISTQMIEAKKAEFPEAKVIIHPEAPPEVIHLADEVLSTGGMCRFVRETNAKQVIIATESGIIHRLKKENPELLYIPLSEQMVCPDMKMTRIVDVMNALEHMQHRITVPEAIRVKAEIPIIRMLEGSE